MTMTEPTQIKRDTLLAVTVDTHVHGHRLIVSTTLSPTFKQIHLETFGAD